MGRELKNLNRGELIEIIYQLKKSEQELQLENESLRKQLEMKRVAVSEAGSLAEAALALTDIFSNAQAAADIYLSEIAQRRNEIEQDCSGIVSEAQKKADDILRDAVIQRDAIVSEAKKAYSLLKKCNAALEKKKIELAMYSRQE